MNQINETIRICLFEDHPIVMQALRDAVGDCLNIQVVGEGTTMNSVLDLVETTHPDVIVLDLSMPEDDGEEDEPTTDGIFLLLQQIKRKSNCKIIIFSSQLMKFIIRELLEGGIKGYIYKGDDMSLDIPNAIAEVHLGGIFYSKSVSRILFEIKDSREFILTQRQLELIEYFKMNENGTNLSAAQFFQISEETVKKHLKGIYKQLNLEGSNKRAQMLKIVSEMVFINQ